jgi:hypothetical protein
MKRLSSETTSAIEALRDAVGPFESALQRVLEAVQADIDKAEEWAEAKSEKWAESDAGIAHDEWRTSIAALRDLIDTTMDAVDELAPELAEVQFRMPEMA